MDATTVLVDERGLRVEQEIAGRIMRVLLDTYPGYPWDVTASLQGGHATIRLVVPLMDNFGLERNPGYLLHMTSLMGSSGLRKVISAGGEILERWNLMRGKAPADWVEGAWESGLDRGNMILRSRH